MPRHGCVPRGTHRAPRAGAPSRRTPQPPSTVRAGRARSWVGGHLSPLLRARPPFQRDLARGLASCRRGRPTGRTAAPQARGAALPPPPPPCRRRLAAAAAARRNSAWNRPAPRAAPAAARNDPLGSPAAPAPTSSRRAPLRAPARAPRAPPSTRRCRAGLAAACQCAAVAGHAALLLLRAAAAAGSCAAAAAACRAAAAAGEGCWCAHHGPEKAAAASGWCVRRGWQCCCSARPAPSRRALAWQPRVVRRGRGRAWRSTRAGRSSRRAAVCLLARV